MIGQLVGARRWRTRRALKAARMIDEVVDTQLPLLASFDEERRRRSADYLAELVKLAQDYRYFAHGWIDAKELDRRGRVVVANLTRMRVDPRTRLITD
ncbi:hypothetical protein [Saccharothrix australiensis]|uniref:Uncharacterized protein n=1 Tax=Saccharothrix australiensis TaxID=2072 RepID=A0A495VW43_9PSEU|nr:hypothetical protein [Saccharothrix australiensis]RKT51888.1 hypothetical protein C8E97_0378 [Saccharothrix australiensis]